LRGIVFFTDSRAKNDVTVFDTTLRDGEQTPGIAFTFEQKIEIARQLSDIGVHTIEAGIPCVIGRRERDCCRDQKTRVNRERLRDSPARSKPTSMPVSTATWT